MTVLGIKVMIDFDYWRFCFLFTAGVCRPFWSDNIWCVILLSVGMGAQDSLMCSIVAKMVSANKRAFAYRISNGIYALF